METETLWARIFIVVVIVLFLWLLFRKKKKRTKYGFKGLDSYQTPTTALKTYLDDYADNSLLTVSSMAGIAACYEGQNKYQEAADQYEKVIRKYPDYYLRAEYMMSAARCNKTIGKSDKAKEWYQQVVKDFPESSYSREAKLALDELGA